jgi:two-component system sensor kinase FixL
MPTSSLRTVAETRLNALLDAAVDAMVLIDGRGLITRFNLAAQRVFGYDEREVLGRNVSMLMPQPYRREHDGYLERYAATHEPRIIGIGREVVAQRKDGSTFPIDLSVGEFETDGERGYVGILRDISQRKAQDERLRESEARLAGIIDSAMDAMISTDASQHIVLFNAAAERMFGCRSDEALGQPIERFIPVRFRDAHATHIRQFGETGITRRAMGQQRPIWGLRTDGTEFPIDASISQTETGSGRVFTVILRDITQKKEQEEQLRRSEENLRLIFENAPTAILITEPRGHITAANPTACRLLGYEVADLAGLRQSDLVVDDDRPQAISSMRMTVESGENAEFEARYSRKDKSSFHALTHISVARDSAGAPILVISEIIDRSALLAATREADEMRTRLAHVARIGTLGEMVSGIAHEVNQPLTAIANYANACRRMIASGQAQPSELGGALEKIAAQAERAGEVIRGLRNLLRKRNQVREPLDCNQLVREVVRITDFELRQSGFRLVQTLAPSLPSVVGDGVQIQQILINLIRNAFEAMHQRSSQDVVEISTGTNGDWVEILVADSGPGIPAAVAERLFEPFFTTKTQGIGLGLSICKSIMEAHKGHLQFSTNAWGGTTFHIRLPAAPELP